MNVRPPTDALATAPSMECAVARIGAIELGRVYVPAEFDPRWVSFLTQDSIA